MGTTPVCYIDQYGIHRPDLATCLAYYSTGYQGIYGQDTYLGSDSQDGELMGFLAACRDDGNALAVSAYNAYSPATSQGTGLSTNIKINGLERLIPTQSTVPILNVGQTGVTVNAGVLSDGVNTWTMPAFTFPGSGQTTVTATCQTLGSVILASGTVLTMVNPTAGWQSATAAANATQGAPSESDAVLRLRQSRSTQMPSQSFLGSVQGALGAITGVTRLEVYQNDTDSQDINGVPGYSIAVVLEGGDAQTIANAIAIQKFGCGTYGTTSETVLDVNGIPHLINFYYATIVPITVGVTIAPGPQFSTNTISLIQQSLAAWVNQLGIGGQVQLTRAYQAAYLAPLVQSLGSQMQAAAIANNNGLIVTLNAQLAATSLAATTYEITGLTFARDGGTLTAADVPIAFNEDPNIPVNSDGSLVSQASILVTI